MSLNVISMLSEKRMAYTCTLFNRVKVQKKCTDRTFSTNARKLKYNAFVNL